MAEKRQRGLAEMWQLAAPKTKRKKEESEKEQEAMAAKVFCLDDENEGSDSEADDSRWEDDDAGRWRLLLIYDWKLASCVF